MPLGAHVWRAPLFCAVVLLKQTQATGLMGTAAIEAFIAALKGSAGTGVVFDVGANNGEWTEQLMRRLDRESLARRVHPILFEPQPQYQQALERLVERWSGTLYPAVAWTAFEPAVTFYISTRTQTSSLSQLMALARNDPKDHGLNTQLKNMSVPAVDLAEVVNGAISKRGGGPSLLKLDVEAAEALLLPHLLTAGTLCGLTALIVEWHVNGMAPGDRLHGVLLRHSLEDTLKKGCRSPPLLVHDDDRLNNYGVPVPGLRTLVDIRESRVDTNGQQPRHFDDAERYLTGLTHQQPGHTRGHTRGEAWPGTDSHWARAAIHILAWSSWLHSTPSLSSCWVAWMESMIARDASITYTLHLHRPKPPDRAAPLSEEGRWRAAMLERWDWVADVVEAARVRPRGGNSTFIFTDMDVIPLRPYSTLLPLLGDDQDAVFARTMIARPREPVNLGFVLFRPSNAMLAFVHNLSRRVAAFVDTDRVDQVAAGALLRGQRNGPVRGQHGGNGVLRWGLLPADIIATGRTELISPTTIAFHAVGTLSPLSKLRALQKAFEVSGSRAVDFPETCRKGNSLASYFDSVQHGPGVWKWMHYFDVYERHLARFRGTNAVIVEVGIYSGGSLRMWRHYFGWRAVIVGIDISKNVTVYKGNATFGSPNAILVGDQGDPKFWQRVKQRFPRVDVLLDDGGHTSHLQEVTLREMWPHLAPGGVYLCEDIHSRDNLHAANVFRRFVNGPSGVNSIPPTCANGGGTIGAVRRGAVRREKSEEHCGRATSDEQQFLASATFHPYVVALEKRKSPLRYTVAYRHGTKWQPPLGLSAHGKGSSHGTGGRGSAHVKLA